MRQLPRQSREAERRSPVKPAASSPVPPQTVKFPTKKKNKKPVAEQTSEGTSMETNVNLKRKRDSEEGSSKNMPKNSSPIRHSSLTRHFGGHIYHGATTSTLSTYPTPTLSTTTSPITSKSPSYSISNLTHPLLPLFSRTVQKSVSIRGETPLPHHRQSNLGKSQIDSKKKQ